MLNFKHDNLPWLADRTIYYVRHGSHAYGTNTPSSDEDFKGVAVAPLNYYLGFSKVFEQAESHTPDVVVYELRKFFRLAADCNPNIFEVLFVDPGDIIHCSKAGELLLEHRDKFLSKKAKHTFCGYAISQLKRIETHRRWLLNPPSHKPTRSEFGLPETTLVPGDQLAAAEAAVRKEMDSWELDLSGLDDAKRIEVLEHFSTTLTKLGVTSDGKPRQAGILLGFDQNMLEVLDRERKYNVALKEWQNYQGWKETRNTARAELEAKFGYDSKHAYHLVRLLRMCREILTKGQVIVKRPDAEELLAIRNGAWSYDQLVDWAKTQDAEMQELAKASTLPRTPDLAALDAVCTQIIHET